MQRYLICLSFHFRLYLKVIWKRHVMKNKKVVVTGGAGFIGSNLARSLANDNKVVVIDDLSSGYIENIKDLIDDGRIDFVKGSITDLSLLKKLFKDVDFVFHEAAIAFIIYSIKKLPMLLKENVGIKASKMKKELLFFSFPLLTANMLESVITWTDTLLLGYFTMSYVVGL